MSLYIRERPSLRLEAGIVTPTGRRYRWAADEPKPENAPSGYVLTTTMPGGFAEVQSCALARNPNVDYADLEPLSDVTFRGPGGHTVWEGRLESSPRASGDQMSISPGCAGWQGHLDDNQNVQAIYVCQDPTLWADAPLSEQIRVGAGGISYGDMSWASQGGLVCALPNSEIGDSIAEVWFIAPSNVKIAAAQYAGSDVSMPAGWEAPFLFSHSDLLEDPATTDALTLDGTLRAVACSSRSRAVSLRVYSQGITATPAAGAMRSLTNIAVYGDTGIPTYPIDSATPNGVLASDVVMHALRTWCPLLSFTPGDSIPASVFVIPQLIFTSLPNTTTNIITGATQYELQDWAVWEQRRFYMNQRGERGTEWRTRVRDCALNETGPQVSRLWNQAVVQYQDVDGTQRTVGPPGSGCDTEDPSLVDLDPLNPANQNGETRCAVTQMGTSSAVGAIQVGARFLQYQKELDASGQATLTGHVEDSHGVLWPASKPRAGDTLRVVDSSDPSPRRMVSTSYDDSAKANNVSLDSPPDALDALLQRMSIELVGTGLS